MSMKKHKPTSPGRRFMSTESFADVSDKAPEKKLVEKLTKKGGRNNTGQITVRHRGGGHKRRYRKIDWRREKLGVPAKVAAIEYDPNRTARIALLQYADGERRYILAPANLKVGTEIVSSAHADIKPGNCMKVKYIPLGTTVHNIEIRPG